MFDFSISELLVVAVVALIAVGPRDLPRALHAMGRWVGKTRAMAREFHRHVDEIVRETDLEDFHRKAETLNRKSLAQVLENVVDPEGQVRRGLELPASKISESSTSQEGLVGSSKEKEGSPARRRGTAISLVEPTTELPLPPQCSAPLHPP